MSTERTLFLIEDYEAVPRRELFRVWDVPITFTPLSWLQIPIVLALGFVVAFLFRDDAIPVRLLIGVLYGLMFGIAFAMHDLGHIFIAKRVNAPMEECIITATRPVTLYGPYDFDLPGEIHLARVAGGPLANFLAAAISLFIFRNFVDLHVFAVFGYANLLLAIITVLPIPSLDGEVIWRELPKLRRNRY